jgi:prepilin-type N-terminal cleavage/methylation domain-containing protein/prepilin-type processing-associated H-X9-DG protein
MIYNAGTVSQEVNMGRRRRGFSLVELLVVVGIIAVLVGILMPALTRARRQANAASCLSNLRQLAYAYGLYVSDNGGKSFTYDGGNSGYWVPLLRPTYGGVDAVMLCPDAREPATIRRSSTGITGTAFEAWTKVTVDRQPIGSYTLNGYLYRYDEIGRGGTNNPNANFQGPPQDSASVPLFGDGIWPNGWPRETDPVPGNLYDHDKGNMMGRYCIVRHNKAVNMVFADGHAALTQLDQLWTLTWSRVFQPTRVTVVLP